VIFLNPVKYSTRDTKCYLANNNSMVYEEIVVLEELVA